MVENPKTYINGIIIFTIIVISGLTLFGLLNATTGQFTNNKDYTAFNQAMNQSTNVITETNSLQANAQNTAKSPLGVLGFIDTVGFGVWGTLSMLGNSLGFMGAVWTYSISFFGLPPVIGDLIGGLVVTLIIFGIYSLIFRVNW